MEGIAGADVSGTVTLDGGVFACVANLPTAVSPGVTLRLTGGDANQSADAVLRACGVADVLGTTCPRSLLDLAGAEITGFEVRVSPAGDGPARTRVTIGFPRHLGARARLVAVGDIELEVNVTRAAGYRPEVVTGYGVEVRGRIDLGRTRYAVRATMPQAGPWAVEILDAAQVDVGPAPPLPELAGFAGFDHAQVLAALPGALVDRTEAITVSQVRLLVDPVAQSLVRVDWLNSEAGTGRWSTGRSR